MNGLIFMFVNIFLNNTGWLRFDILYRMHNFTNLALIKMLFPFGDVRLLITFAMVKKIWPRIFSIFIQVCLMICKGGFHWLNIKWEFFVF